MSNQDQVIDLKFYNSFQDPYEFFQEWLTANQYDINSIDSNKLHSLLENEYSLECDRFFNEYANFIDCEVNNNPPF